MTKPAVNIFWFRRDLRLHDNSGLWHALRSDRNVLPVFIFDRNILDKLTDRNDRRVEFIRMSLEKIQSVLAGLGSSLEFFYGLPEDCFQELFQRYDIGSIFSNRDYEPYARDRDEAIRKLAASHSAGFHSFKDQVIFDHDEVVKSDGKPYTVFTPYSRQWKSRLTPYHLKPYPTEKYFSRFFRQAPQPIPSLLSMGFRHTDREFPSPLLDESVVSAYSVQRDFPAAGGTSRLGVHLRFGTISIRRLCQRAMEVSETFLNELIWREFFQMILWHFPKLGMGKSFREAYDRIPWRNNEEEFAKWCRGMTGYPIVDAGMRELNETGFMHNRVRMIVASFLTKHLLIDWRWGEAYFAEKLLDYDLAANNGGWQWAAGSGCDAAPYFRIFNPALQTKKFDPELRYIRKWVPEMDGPGYPAPIIDHEIARKRGLALYGKALKREN